MDDAYKYAGIIALVGMTCAFGLGWVLRGMLTKPKALPPLPKRQNRGWTNPRVKGQFVRRPAHFEGPKFPCS
jgi:hypothetical protein